jgi:methionyl-tRNA formyltransferase
MEIGIVAKHDLYFPPIKKALESLPVSHSTVFAKNLEELINLERVFDYVFFPHYSRLVPENFHTQNLCVGFHVGNLPEDRGGSPIQNKILRGEYKTFLNAFQINTAIDGGPVYDQRAIDLEFGNVTQILESLAEIISEMIIKIICSENIPKEQPTSPIRFHRLNRQDSEIDLSNLTLKQIYDRIRMVDGLDYPRAKLGGVSKVLSLTNAKLNGDVLTFDCEVKND